MIKGGDTVTCSKCDGAVIRFSDDLTGFKSAMEHLDKVLASPRCLKCKGAFFRLGGRSIHPELHIKERGWERIEIAGG
jgi:hypothetical protein